MLRPFSALAPSKLILLKKLRIGYVYIEETFDTIFNMGYGPGKSPMDDRVKYMAYLIGFNFHLVI